MTVKQPVMELYLLLSGFRGSRQVSLGQSCFLSITLFSLILVTSLVIFRYFVHYWLSRQQIPTLKPGRDSKAREKVRGIRGVNSLESGEGNFSQTPSQIPPESVVQSPRGNGRGNFSPNSCDCPQSLKNWNYGR